MSSAVDLHELLRGALDTPAGRRAAFLDAACAGDAALRAHHPGDFEQALL